MPGAIYLGEQMSPRLLKRLLTGGTDKEDSPILGLSDRELQVFEMIGMGMGAQEISDKLHLSVKTIESHRANLKAKLRVDSATELLRHAINWVQSEKSTSPEQLVAGSDSPRAKSK